ncbi:hypothetical protein Acr_23g0019860 [Actinidia rufa]|uniref:DDE Tnp4 domain-containing protein n=1 Tax=Actinidia rufa TaxID=165716 RepID=A0A7J0GS62_9ERIC|nr:hypothetical protein Acr_23g0019860 [Actinidia rufa]
MPPLKKTKKPKRDSKKLKKRKIVSAVPAESKAIDSDWWENFWHKNSPIAGSTVISDEEEGFKYFFRVSKKTFDYICSLVRQDLVSRPPSGLINIEGRLLSVEKQVAIALRRLASGESQVSVGASFGVGQSTVSQVIVDNEMRFLDIVTGWPGRMPISRLLKCSGFYKLCYSGSRLNGNARTNSDGAEIREFIVGGVNYPLLSWLITPYESGGLSAGESEFNAIHEAARLLAVKALAQLKGCWRILNKVMWRPDKQKLPSIILVCCFLHNIIIDGGDNILPDVALSGHHDSGYAEQCCKQVDPLGRTTRENLVRHLQLSKQNALPN